MSTGIQFRTRPRHWFGKLLDWMCHRTMCGDSDWAFSKYKGMRCTLARLVGVRGLARTGYWIPGRAGRGQEILSSQSSSPIPQNVFLVMTTSFVFRRILSYESYRRKTTAVDRNCVTNMFLFIKSWDHITKHPNCAEK